MVSLNNEPCCICGNSRSELAWETGYPEHGYPGSFQLRRCSGCGLLFNSPRLEPDELSKLYGGSYYFFKRPDSREFDRAVSMYRRSVALLSDVIEDKRTLDIGGGRGYLPALLKQLGWSANAVEISPEAAQYGRGKFGLSVFTGTIEQYVSGQHDTFPLVTAIDVIEHVPDPVAFVQAAAAVLTSGGRLLIDTPNAASKNIRVEGIGWQGFNPFHIFLFNPDNLKLLLENAGLTVEKQFTYGNALADRESRTKVQRWTQSVRKTLPAWLLGPAAKIWFATRNLHAKNGEPAENLKRAATAASSPGNYLTSPDAKGELAKDLTGDNLVIIATKS